MKNPFKKIIPEGSPPSRLTEEVEATFQSFEIFSDVTELITSNFFDTLSDFLEAVQNSPGNMHMR